jgi:hypothetical protein
MRKVFLWCSAGMAAIIGLAFYCWCCPESMLGRCASAAYDFSCQANPVYVLSRQVVRDDARPRPDVEVMGEDALARAKEDPKPCEEEEHTPRAVPVVPLGGVVELPAPIVIKDDEQPGSTLIGAAAGVLGIDPALCTAAFQNQGGADPKPRPMPYAEDADTTAAPVRPMPYIDDDADTAAAPVRPMPYIDDDEEKAAAPERPMPYADESKNSDKFEYDYGQSYWILETSREAKESGCTFEDWLGIDLTDEDPDEEMCVPDNYVPPLTEGCPHMSGCPYCPATREPEVSAPKSGGEECEQPTTKKAKQKHAKKASWWSSNYESEMHPRQPDVDTMEFGPRDRHLYEFGLGPI